MQKTNLGITVTLMGAALYFSAFISYVGLIILAGYVLLFESDEWLKRSAVKAVGIVIGFTLISIIIGLGNDIFHSLNGIVAWFNTSFRFAWPLNFDTIVLNIANAIEKIVLIILGFKAFYKGSMSVGPIDKVIDKNM